EPDNAVVVKATETIGDNTRGKPGRPAPGVSHLAQCGVAAAAGTEPVGAAGELGLVVRLKQQAHHFAEQLVRPGGQAKSAEFAILLGNVDPPGRAEPVALVAHLLDDRPDLA